MACRQILWKPRSARNCREREFRRNSIPGLAEAWSEALAAEGRNSPDEDIDAIKRVTLEDVNRVAKQYLSIDSIAAELKPTPSGAPVASKGFGGAEQLTSAPTKPVELPSWAASNSVAREYPAATISIADLTLPNGLRLIVRTEKITPTVTIFGSVKHDRSNGNDPGKDGVSSVLENLFSYGTKNLDRLAFQKALDDIAADESAGFNFSLQVLKPDFSRGVQLLADNELNPALPRKHSTSQATNSAIHRRRMKSPGYQTGGP